MALRPARTCCTAWLPVSAPSAGDVRLRVEQLPEALARPSVGERVLDRARSRAAARRRLCEYGRTMPSKRSAWRRSCGGGCESSSGLMVRGGSPIFGVAVAAATRLHGRSREQVVRGQGEEVLELGRRRELARRGRAASAKRPPSKRASPTSRADALHLLVDDAARSASAVERRRRRRARVVVGATARPARARSPRSPRLPSGCRAARSRCRAATPRGTGRRRGRCGAGRPRCACPRGRAAGRRR